MEGLHKTGDACSAGHRKRDFALTRPPAFHCRAVRHICVLIALVALVYLPPFIQRASPAESPEQTLQAKVAACTKDTASMPQGLSAEVAKTYCSCIAALDLLTDSDPSRPARGDDIEQTRQSCANRARSAASPSPIEETAGRGSPPPQPPASGELQFPSMLDANGFKDVIVAARDRSPLPRPVAEKASLDCIKSIRSRFPNSSNAYVAGACTCVIDRRDVTPAEVGQTIPSGTLTACGTAALSRLSRAPDVFGPIHDQMLNACRGNPINFGVSTAAEAEQICGCLWDELNASSRPQLVMWKHLGNQQILTKPIERAVSACREKLGSHLSALPFQGRYFMSRRACPDPNDSTPQDEQRFKGNTTLGYETFCTARSITQIGNMVFTQETCQAYEDQSTEKRTYQIVDGRSLKLTINGHISSLYKCQ